MKRVFITGSNRGVGLEFVKQYLESGWRVYATCRRPVEAESLHTLGRVYTHLSIHRLDISVEEDLSRINRQFSDVPLDVLINNGAVLLDHQNTGLEHIDYGSWLRTLEVNTLGTMRVIEALLTSVGKGENGMNLVVVLTTSPCIEMKYKKPAGMYYRSSKAALNSAMNDIDIELQKRKIGLLMLNPGPVSTGSGKDEGVPVEQSVSGMRQLIQEYNPQKNSHLFSNGGSKSKITSHAEN